MWTACFIVSALLLTSQGLPTGITQEELAHADDPRKISPRQRTVEISEVPTQNGNDNDGGQSLKLVDSSLGVQPPATAEENLKPVDTPAFTMTKGLSAQGEGAKTASPEKENKEIFVRHVLRQFFDDLKGYPVLVDKILKHEETEDNTGASSQASNPALTEAQSIAQPIVQKTENTGQEEKNMPVSTQQQQQQQELQQQQVPEIQSPAQGGNKPTVNGLLMDNKQTPQQQPQQQQQQQQQQLAQLPPQFTKDESSEAVYGPPTYYVYPAMSLQPVAVDGQKPQVQVQGVEAPMLYEEIPAYYYYFYYDNDADELSDVVNPPSVDDMKNNAVNAAKDADATNNHHNNNDNVEKVGDNEINVKETAKQPIAAETKGNNFAGENTREPSPRANNEISMEDDLTSLGK